MSWTPVKRRIVVFGGGGFVGGNLCTLALRDGWEVHIVDSNVRPYVPGAAWHALNITDAARVETLLGDIRPEAVIDLAAMADIDRAERERDAAWAVHVDAASTMSAACTAADAYFMYFSSDAVFSGIAERYREEDTVGPVNWYGHTKAEGEKAVRAACPAAAVVRLSLVLGFSVTGAGNSFFAALESKLTEGREVVCPADEIRTPVDVITLSECVLKLLAMRFAGVLHIGSTDSIDRLALTRRAAHLMGYPEARVLPQESSASPIGRAARHKNGIISVAKAQALLDMQLPSAERAIRRAIEERI